MRKQTASGYILGYSKVTAADLARLFSRIDLLTAPRHRAFAMTQLEHVEGAGRFGIYNSGIPGTIRSKGGWRPEDDGRWTVNQAAQITLDGQRYGVAIVLGGQPSFAAGADQIATLTRTLAAAPIAAGACGQIIAGAVGQKVGQIARSYLGKDARGTSFGGFRSPGPVGFAWCAWFATQVWQLAGVDIPLSDWSGYPYQWARAKRQLFKAVGRPPRGRVPPLGSALMYGTGPQTDSHHVNLVDQVNPDGSFMVTGGNQDDSRVTRFGPCRLSSTDPAYLNGPGCDRRPIYGIAAPTAEGL